MHGLAGVELVEDLLGDTLEHLTGEGTAETPGDVERVEDVAHLVRLLGKEALLKLCEELEVQKVLGRQSLLSDDRLHGSDILADCIVGIHLVGKSVVVLARHALSDGRLHKARQRRKHVDGRVHLPVVQLAVDVHLALRDVPGKVGDGMRDVVVGHREHRDLGDRAVTALDTAGTLVDRGKIRIHVTRVATAAGHLLAGSRHLTEGVSIRRHVGEDNENVLVALVSEVLGGGECKTGGDDALDGGVIGEVEEEANVLHRAVLLEILLEKAGSLHVDTHGGEHNGEVGLASVAHTLSILLDETCLPADLGGNLIVGKTSSREEGDLLSTCDRVHRVDSRDACTQMKCR